MTKIDGNEEQGSVAPRLDQENNEISREEYLSGLSKIDEHHAERLSQTFEKVFREDQRGGFLVAVGSIVSGKKRLQRYDKPQDIDLLCVFENKPGEPKQDYQLSSQLKVFEVFIGLVNKMILGIDLNILDINKPYPSLGAKDSVRHSGSIILNGKDDQGMPIEISISNNSQEDLSAHLHQNAKYAVLSCIPYAKDVTK